MEFILIEREKQLLKYIYNKTKKKEPITAYLIKKDLGEEYLKDLKNLVRWNLINIFFEN